MAGVTAMAAGGEQIQSAHACDVSLGARIVYRNTSVIPQSVIRMYSKLIWIIISSKYLTSHSSLATLPTACVTQIAW